MLWFVTRTKSDYSSSSSSGVIQTGDQYKDDAIEKLPDKVKEALKKLPKQEQDNLKTMSIEDFNSKLYQINYEVTSVETKPLYTITGTSSK
jgi:hypothetical protein